MLEVAALYDPSLDGFASIPQKRIRNGQHPSIVWMQKATWTALATHATRDGEFFIPCREGLFEPQELRMLVNGREGAHVH